MNILVTGGAGYVGSHTCKALAAVGHNPVTYDDLSRGNEWAVKWGKLIIGSLLDVDLLRTTLSQERIDAVFHFAALAYVAESMADPGSYFTNNVEGSLRLLTAMQAEGVSKMIFSSSCATYGLPESVPIGEDHPQKPVNPYGESKVMVERALNWYGRIHGMRWVVLRYFNAAGCDADGDIGEAHAPETHLIPLALEAALSGTNPLPVFGTDYPTHDGTAIRDYVHVTDLAEAHVRAIEYLKADAENVAMNLGTGQGYSVGQVIQGVERVTGSRVARIERSRRVGDPPELVADARKSSQVLGWRPVRSSLENILGTAWSWAQRWKGFGAVHG